MEPERQYVTRNVVAKVLRREGLNSQIHTLFADQLERSEPNAVARLREDIAEASAAWSKESKVVAMRHNDVYWRVYPKLLMTENEGPLVRLEWGWGAGIEGEESPSLTTSGEDAFDLAVGILAMFTDEEGEPRRPERPERHEMEQSPEMSRFFEEFSKDANRLMPLLGGWSVSLQEIEAWRISGEPDPPLEHVYVEYPEDHVFVCSVCGHYYYTDRDDCGTRVCAGKLLKGDGIQHIGKYDPRRSSELREAQRLDRLVTYLEKLEATEEETTPFRTSLEATLMTLTKEDRIRYNKDRVGLGEQ